MGGGAIFSVEKYSMEFNARADACSTTLLLLNTEIALLLSLTFAKPSSKQINQRGAESLIPGACTPYAYLSIPCPRTAHVTARRN
jgi:hypothetical protein